MPEKIAREKGFCWDELLTSDVAAAKRFYGPLFGWETAEVSMGPVPYTFARIRGTAAAGLMALTDQHRAMNVPPHWLSYVYVADADGLAAKARELGGKVLAGPMDYGDMGRGAVIADPTGAAFALWQPKGKVEGRITGEPGAAVWNELVSTNPDVSAGFLTKLFGWRTNTATYGTMRYTTLLNGEEPAGGLIEVPKEAAGAPSHWLVYFATEDVDQTASGAQKAGGKVLAPPFDVPNVGRFAVLQDPQGAVFALAKLSGAM